LFNGDINKHISRWREQWRDPLLTILTTLILFLMFVVAPLQAVGIIVFTEFGFIFALVLVGGVFVMSGSLTAVILMLIAVGMAGAAAIFRVKAPSILDIYLFSGAWPILGITLGWVVARAVFARGRVTYHRIIGAVLLYLCIAVVFVALFTIVGLLVSNAFAGLVFEDSPALASSLIYFSFVTLTSTGYGDIVPVHPVARSLCNVETIIGQLYPATLLARLVTLELAGRR
jgi:ion channel